MVVATLSNAQSYTLPLWPDEIPNRKSSQTKESADTSDVIRIRNVQEPTIAVYLPSNRISTGQAMIICPGGGYAILAYDLEGTDIAKWLNAHGIAAIVLKYRLPDNDSNTEPHLTPLMDAQQAIKRVRENAGKWSIDPQKIGVMGFSAGGHLASTLGTHFDETSRPNFMALLYPVISMQEELTHMGSRINLLGEKPSAEQITYYSNEEQVKPNTPPTFIVHSTDDGAVPVENSLRFYEALKQHKIPTEMHIYPYGGHGYGLATGRGYLSTWPDRLIDWLRSVDTPALK